MFRGRFEYTIDAKGRLSIPAKFREVLTNHYDPRLIVTNFDQCLWAYPVPEWLELESKVGSLPQFMDEVKALQRVFISAATECFIDKQGRILVPPSLKAYAGLEGDVVMVGMTRRIEIWSQERWQKVFGEAQEKLESLGSRLAELGL